MLKKFKIRKMRKNIFVVLAIIILFSLSVSYAAYSQWLDIKSIGKIYKEKDGIFVKSVVYKSSVNCGFDKYAPTWTDDSVTVNVELPGLACQMVYTVTIRNNTESYMELQAILNNYFSNADMIYEFQGLEVGSIIFPDEEMTATLTIKYKSGLSALPSANDYSSIIEFVWDEYEGDAILAMISYSPSACTNQSVIASITFDRLGVRVINTAGNSDKYTFTNNGSFTFEFEDQYNNRGSATATVSWIDKVAPTLANVSAYDATDYTITVSGTATDAGGCGLAHYYYSVDDGRSWVGPVGNSTYTITGLIPDTAYSVRMKAVDHAGNETIYPSLSGGAILARTTLDTSTNLPITVNPGDNGSYFNNTTWPNGVTYLGDHWEGSTFTFVLAKPQVPGNSGQNDYAFTLPITNSSIYAWTGGQINAVIGSGVFNKVTPTLTPTTVNPGGTASITHTIQAKIDANSTDKVSANVSYMINGTRKNINIVFYWIPYNGYAIFYNGNDKNATGETPPQICTATAACTLSNNAYTAPPGKSFAGWAVKPDGPVVYPNGSSIPANTYTISSSTQLYAVWH